MTSGDFILCYMNPQRLREEILIMKKYFVTCRQALESKLLLQVFSLLFLFFQLYKIGSCRVFCSCGASSNIIRIYKKKVLCKSGHEFSNLSLFTKMHCI